MYIDKNKQNFDVLEKEADILVFSSTKSDRDKDNCIWIALQYNVDNVVLTSDILQRFDANCSAFVK